MAHRDEQAIISARGCWGLNPGPLEERQALLTIEYLSSLRIIFCISIEKW